MNQDRDALLKGIQIAAPCQSSWDAMQGDDKQRFCKQCSLNVYNLSSMTESEIGELIERNQSEESICVSFFRRGDGTILTENCPVGLRRLRQSLRTIATSVATVVSFLLAFTAAQAKRIPFSASPELLPSNPEIQRAAQEYECGKYKQALTRLEKLSIGANDDVVHYYKALCLQALNQFGNAKKEYSWVASNTHHAELKSAALQGIDFLSSYKVSIPAIPSRLTLIPQSSYGPKEPVLNRQTGGIPVPKRPLGLRSNMLPGRSGPSFLP